MGIFSTLKMSNTYDNGLKQFGVRPRDIPAAVNAKICSYAEQNYKRRAASASYFNQGSEGLNAEIANAAELVAYCVIGRTAFINAGGLTAGTMDMVIQNAADDWRDSGSESSLNAMIIKILNEAELLCSEFVAEFNLL